MANKNNRPVTRFKIEKCEQGFIVIPNAEPSAYSDEIHAFSTFTEVVCFLMSEFAVNVSDEPELQGLL